MRFMKIGSVGVALMAIALSAGQWTFQQTCVKCQVSAACLVCERGATYGNKQFCGSYDYVEGCRRMTKRTMTCLGCNGQPDTYGMDYEQEWMLGFVCTGGQDCY